MKKLCATLLLSLPLMASAVSNCDEISASIADKIKNNGVPAANFQLKLIPTDQEDQQIEGQIVGSCDRGQQKIVYLRTDSVQLSPSVKETDVKTEVEVNVKTDANVSDSSDSSNSSSNNDTEITAPVVTPTEDSN